MSMTAKTKTLFLRAVGLAAPGLEGWQNSLPVLRGESSWQIQEQERHKPRLLPANERRRATDTVRLAFHASEDALAQLGIAHTECGMATVFASSGGDYPVMDQLCRALAKPERELSPTVFHNSVHNAPAGYWGIGTGWQRSATALSAYDNTFAAGLLEAAMLLVEDEEAVLLTVYDSRPPFPLDQSRRITLPFACSFVLTRQRDFMAEQLPLLASLSIDVESMVQAESTATITALETLRVQNPAARCLPLLEALAKQQAGDWRFTLPGKNILRVELRC
jgi:hypothetical protein